MTEESILKVEKETWGQSENKLWFDMRKGRLTASKHHDYYTKINTISKSHNKKGIKTTPMVADIMYGAKKINNPALNYGIENEENALKAFYADQVKHHEKFSIDKAGLFISYAKPFVAASPDAMMTCKCHGKSTVEIKCPYSLKDEVINLSNSKNCSFLCVENGKIQLKRSHKYYTQIISQMALTKTAQSYFVVWTNNSVFVEEIKFDERHWSRVETNLDVFYKTFVCLAILLIRPILFCGKCDKFILQENEILQNEQKDQSKIQCNDCCCYFHKACEQNNFGSESLSWVCSLCLQSIGSFV